jgi:arginase family enzyme
MMRPDSDLLVKTTAVFFPFDLFGSAGASNGVLLLADALKEMLADNRRERRPTRARAYADKVRVQELALDTLEDYQDWRKDARKLARQLLKAGDFLVWVTGNHLGTLPVYEELGQETLVVQLDAHLDVYNLSDCTSELSHGNFLLHAESLPRMIGVGNRELLLPPAHVAKYYQATFSAVELAIDPETALAKLRHGCGEAARVFIDIDCDVFDPAFFPAVSHPLPFGMSPTTFLRVLDAVWSERIAGVSISEFEPARDQNDRSLATLVWLMEYVLLKRYGA